LEPSREKLLTPTGSCSRLGGAERVQVDVDEERVPRSQSAAEIAKEFKK
jgi:hypothetical protein